MSAVLSVPQPVKWEPQNFISDRACAWLLVSPRAAPASKKMEQGFNPRAFCSSGGVAGS